MMKLLELVNEKLADCNIQTQEYVGELTITVPAAELHQACKILHDDADLKFQMLVDLCGVDYSTYGQAEWQTNASSTGFSRGVNRRHKTADIDPSKRYAVVYHLLSVKNNQRVRVKSFAEDSEFPVMDSVVDIWSSANWYEREAFDLYGIVFDGHPDLRRILTDYGFIGHPFRKDFPLSGNVEVRYDEEKKRVVYQPVSIEPRVLVPRVIREEHPIEEKPEQESPDA